MQIEARERVAIIGRNGSGKSTLLQMISGDVRADTGTMWTQPALKIAREDGNRDLVLRYTSHRIQQNDLDIVLKDVNDAIEVTLHYHVYPEHGILRRGATVRNGTARPITVESAQSATWNLPPLSHSEPGFGWPDP